MIRVGDLAKSIDFYTNVLGMKLLRTTDRPEQQYRLAFVGYGDEAEHAVLELTHNYGIDKYDLGTGYGHVAIEVDDAAAACAAVRSKGGNVTREAGPVKGGTTVIAFVQDPDGYKIELIEHKRRKGRLAVAAARRQPTRDSRRSSLRSCAITSAPWLWPT